MPSPPSAGGRRTWASACSASSTMLPLTLLLRRRRQLDTRQRRGRPAIGPEPPPASPAVLQGLLVLAGVACCVAMSMPQVHIVAYCGDLGYGAGARGRDAVDDAGHGRRQPAGLGLHRRPDRRRRHADPGLGAAVPGAAVLPALRRPDLALPRLGAVRPLAGRHRAELRADRARIFPGRGGRHPGQPRADGDRRSAWRWAAGCRARSTT